MRNPTMYVKNDRFTLIEVEDGFITVDKWLDHLDFTDRTGITALKVKHNGPFKEIAPSDPSINETLRRHGEILELFPDTSSFVGIYRGDMSENFIYDLGDDAYMLLMTTINLLMFEYKGTKRKNPLTDVPRKLEDKIYKPLEIGSDMHTYAIREYNRVKQLVTLRE